MRFCSRLKLLSCQFTVVWNKRSKDTWELCEAKGKPLILTHSTRWQTTNTKYKLAQRKCRKERWEWKIYWRNDWEWISCENVCQTLTAYGRGKGRNFRGIVSSLIYNSPLAIEGHKKEVAALTLNTFLPLFNINTRKEKLLPSDIVCREMEGGGLKEKVDIILIVKT